MQNKRGGDSFLLPTLLSAFSPAAHLDGHPRCQISLLCFSYSLLWAALSNPASNQGKLQPLHKQMLQVLLHNEMLLPGSSLEHQHQFPQGQVGASGLQGEGSCLLSSFIKRLQGSYTKAPNLVGDKPLTGPQLPQPRCRDRNLPNSPPRSGAVHPTWAQCR